MKGFSNVTDHGKFNQLYCRPIPDFNVKEKAERTLVTVLSKQEPVPENKIAE